MTELIHVSVYLSGSELINEQKLNLHLLPPEKKLDILRAMYPAYTPCEELLDAACKILGADVEVEPVEKQIILFTGMKYYNDTVVKWKFGEDTECVTTEQSELEEESETNPLPHVNSDPPVIITCGKECIDCLSCNACLTGDCK